jgi:hypothetical protein
MIGRSVDLILFHACKVEIGARAITSAFCRITALIERVATPFRCALPISSSSSLVKSAA